MQPQASTSDVTDFVSLPPDYASEHLQAGWYDQVQEW